MSKIKNEPRIKNALIVAVREQLEHRALRPLPGGKPEEESRRR